MVLPRLEKGSAVIMVVVAGMIMILMTGTFATGIFYRVARDLMGQNVMCEVFCAMQSNVREVTTLDMVQGPGALGTAGWVGAGTVAASSKSIGGWAAAKVGLKVGAKAGSIVPGKGTVIGAAVGAGVGLAVAGLHSLISRMGRDDEDVWRDLAIDHLIRPEGMGCYCGVQDNMAPYIHLYSRDGGEEIGEFHLTDTNPEEHLQEDINDTDGNIIFRHKGGYDECTDALQGHNDFESLVELEMLEGCVIVSVLEDGSDCEIWGFDEGVEIDNIEGRTIYQQAYEQDKIILNTGLNQNDPVYSMEIGETFYIDGGDDRHPSQRILLENYMGGQHTFELYEPITCVSEERGEGLARDAVERACQQQCYDQDTILWDALCFEEHEQAGEYYEELHDDYVEDLDIEDKQKLCPIGEKNDEDNDIEYGHPYCLCTSPRVYNWERVEED